MPKFIELRVTTGDECKGLDILINTDNIIWVVGGDKYGEVRLLVSKPGSDPEVFNVVNSSFDEISSYLTDSVVIPEHAYA